MRVVHSSHGEIACKADGTVIGVDYDACGGEAVCLDDIARFDFDEYFYHYADEDRSATDEFDILDVGYWTKDGKFEPPEPDFRERVRLNGVKKLRFVRDSDLLVHGPHVPSLTGNYLVPGDIGEEFFAKGSEVNVKYVEPGRRPDTDQYWVTLVDGRSLPVQREDVELVYG